MGRVLRACVLAGIGLLSVASAQVYAQASATYEDSRVELALAEAGLELDPAPGGKRIAFIRLVRHDVFVAGEPWPEWPNAFHTQTHPAVIEREYLFAERDVFNQALIEETERNLRGMGIFALVRIVMVKTGDANTVGVLVHTRDLWSLRTEWDLQITGLDFGRLIRGTVGAALSSESPTFAGAVVDRLLLQGAERNIAGRNKAVIARLQLNPITFSVGEVYLDRRFFLGQHRLEQTFDVFFNRSSGVVEGSQGQVVVSKPFYSLAQSLSYRLDANYVTKIARVLQTGRVDTYDIPETDEVETISRVWDDRSGAMVASASYRVGERFKRAFTGGLGFRDRSVRPNEQTGLRADEVVAFQRDVLPRVRREVFPSVALELFEARFVVYRDLGTFGSSENVRVGPSMSAVATLPLRAWGSSSDSIAFALNLGYVLPIESGLLEAAVGASGRYENGVLINRLLTLQARGATPRSPFGRFMFRWLFEPRNRDKDNTSVSLGGDNGLRGFPSQSLIGFGATRFLGNLEYRTPPLIWKSVQAGAVAFYDAGTVYERLSNIVVHQSVGTGLRILFPQFDRYVFRVDLGLPLDTPGFQLLAGFGGGQALPMTATEDERLSATY